ncbi:MAG: protein translocase subunit SecF, partial [Paracoccaceae bacterium]|nr:protein translocase subunit SecF [Paracoccaceae bacterium]
MAFRLKLVPDHTTFDFFKHAWLTFGASVVATIASIVLALVLGLNFGIDFKGGTTIRTESTQALDVGLYRGAIAPLNLGDVSITQVFDPNFAADQHVPMIRIQAQSGAVAITPETIASVEAALQTV